MEVNQVEAIRITTTDGQERKLLLTRGALKRIREALKVQTIADVMTKVAVDEGGAQSLFLYQCLLDKSGLTLDGFEDIMPVSIEADLKTIMALIGASMPKADADRPPVPSLPVIQ